MERIRSVEVPTHVGQRVRVAGWLHAVRRLGGVTFVVVRDGWGTIQCVARGNSGLEAIEQVALESVVTVDGTVVAAPKGQGGVELHEPRVAVLTAATEPPPIPMHQRELAASLPALLDHAVVANRHPTRRALFRIASVAMGAFREALCERGFTEVQTPKLVAAATESGANVFALEYFGGRAYLAQSPQFYKQAMVGVFERVFEVGPVFRAEPHETTRHVNEYVSLDVELGFVESHFTVMALVREVLAAIIARLGERCGSELALAGAALPAVPEVIPHLHFAEAIALASELTGADARGEPDLAPAHERALGEWAAREKGSEWLFVTGYPMRKRPFYTHPEPGREEYSNSFDLLFRGTELITGGQRLHRHEDYVAALGRAGLPLEPFASYLEAFRHGMPPHGGFAIGLERLVMQLTGAGNIRLATLFPRDMGRLTP